MTRLSSKHQCLLILIAASLQCFTNGFTNIKVSRSRPVIYKRELAGRGKSAFIKLIHTEEDTYMNTSLSAKKERSRVFEESEKRGNYLFGFVLLVVVWSFTIPPELRRTHFCFSRTCRLDNTGKLCYDCTSFGEWATKVSNYYKGGGGINFDFSIEEKD